MSQPWSQEEDKHLTDLMGYDGSGSIPERPTHVDFQSWTAVSQGMKYHYVEDMTGVPRTYTIQIVRDRWNNHIVPRLILDVSTRLLANVSACINHVSSLEEDLLQMLEPTRGTETAKSADGKVKGRAVD
jgi:hypothetical protein